MDICIIAPPWLPVPAPAYGGTEAVLDQLARGLRRAGHHVLLIGHPDSTCAVERRSIVPAEETEPMGRGAIELEHALGAYEMARYADVVHDHTIAGPLLARRYPELPVITTNHGPFTRNMTALYKAMVPQVGLVCISHSQAASTTLPVEAVVHHGIDIDQFPAGAGRGGYAVFLGRMAPEKGAHRAIATARAAGIPLYMAAKMREQLELDYFDAEIRPHLGPDVVYLGEIDFASKVALLADAVALVNPIRWPEPFGMVMLESLACGTPVVGHPEGAAPEIVEHNRSGLLTRTAAGLARALAGVDRLDRAECRRRAEVFSTERMVDGYLRVFSRWRDRRVRDHRLALVTTGRDGSALSRVAGAP